MTSKPSGVTKVMLCLLPYGYVTEWRSAWHRAAAVTTKARCKTFGFKLLHHTTILFVGGTKLRVVHLALQSLLAVVRHLASLWRGAMLLHILSSVSS